MGWMDDAYDVRDVTRTDVTLRARARLYTTLRLR